MKKVQAGDPLQIKVETFNTLIDAARDFQSRQQSRHQQHVPRQPGSGIIKVKNTSGAAVDRLGVLGISEPIILPTDNEDAFVEQVALVGVLPDENDHLEKGVILCEPIANGEIGRAWAAGICPARVNVTDESLDRADIKDTYSDYLETRADGAVEILWKEEGDGQKWAVVRFGTASAEDEPLALNGVDSAEVVPRYGVFASYSGQRKSTLTNWSIGPRVTIASASVQAKDLCRSRQYFINLGGRVLGQYHPDNPDHIEQTGICTPAVDGPYWARAHDVWEQVHANSDDALGTTCGLVPRPGYPELPTYSLGPYLPGFIIMRSAWQYVNADDPPDPVDDGWYVTVMRDFNSQFWWCKATSTARYHAYKFITANPCSPPHHDGTAKYAYDGEDGWPEIEFTVRTPSSPGQDPNIEVGDVLRYTATGRSTVLNSWPSSSGGAWATLIGGEYLDDKVGSVKIWSGSESTIPRNWRIWSNMSGRFAAGYKEDDPNFGSAGSIGGALTHTHSAGTGLGTGATVDPTATHLPPYRTVLFIVRYQ